MARRRLEAQPNAAAFERPLPRSEKILIHFSLGVLEFDLTEVNNYGSGLRPKTHISGSS